MTRYHLINGTKVAFTAEEETARDAEEARFAAEITATEYKTKREEIQSGKSSNVKIVKKKKIKV